MKVSAGKTQIFNYKRLLEQGVFPILLFLFPLFKINQGVDFTDAGYSLGNYRFFESMEGTWVLATYLANAAGHFFTLLPFGGTMMGMNFYTALFVSIMALFAYRFFVTKMPPWIAFLGVLLAIGLCWCPTAILYNYMTYFFFLLGAVFLFRGLVGERPIFLILAGISLGLNIFVRFPNIIEAALILCVWYYGILRRKTIKKVIRETAYCMAGYLSAILVMLLIIMVNYGITAYIDMIAGIFGMAGSASDYTLAEMISSIFDAYWHGFKWFLYFVICVLPGIPFLMIEKERFLKIRKIIYCFCILLLFIVLGRWGMYNFKYYQKEAALQWSAVFLILSLGVLLWMLLSKTIDFHWKLIASMAVIIILITPLGSNNHIWPIINNLFFIAPIILWMTYKFAKWGKEYMGTGTIMLSLFPIKAMQLAIVTALLIQSVGLGCFYVFMDGENGEKRDSKITDNRVTAGMYTTARNAKSLEEISIFLEEHRNLDNKKIILYGNIPALSYYLDKAPAIFSSWPDLDTNSVQQLQNDLDDLTAKIQIKGEERPFIIVPPSLSAYITDDAEGISLFNTDIDKCKEDKKLKLIINFITENNYKEIFNNDKFVIFV